MATSHDEVRSGGCQCGAIRYRIEGPLSKAGICHCRMCQKAFGNFGAALVSVPVGQFTWTRGEPGAFRSSSIVSRGYCRDCGTPLFMQEDGDGNIELAIGTLDNPNDVGPLTEQSGMEGKVTWFDSMRDLPEQRTTDYRSPADMVKLASRQHPDHDTGHWP